MRTPLRRRDAALLLAALAAAWFACRPRRLLPELSLPAPDRARIAARELRREHPGRGAESASRAPAWRAPSASRSPGEPRPRPAAAPPPALSPRPAAPPRAQDAPGKDMSAPSRRSGPARLPGKDALLPSRSAPTPASRERGAPPPSPRRPARREQARESSSSSRRRLHAPQPPRRAPSPARRAPDRFGLAPGNGRSDTRRTAAARARRSSPRALARAGPLFRPVEPPRRERAGSGAGPARRPVLAHLLGRGALRPPPPGLNPPASLRELPLLRPERDPLGKPTPAAPAGLDALQSAPLESLEPDTRRRGHWDGPFWHDGAARGLVSGQAWLWLQRQGRGWWALTAQGPATRRDGLWWVKDAGLWYVVHEGEPWVWRHFRDWQARGLFHARSGTEIVYSADFRRAAVIVPGEGAVVFDAESGEELGRIPESAMPARRRPRAPSSLTLP